MSRWKMTRNTGRKQAARSKTALRTSVGLDAIEHLARAAARSCHAELRVGNKGLEGSRTVHRPGAGRVGRPEQLSGHAGPIIRHVEIDLHLAPGDHRCTAEL